MSVLANQNKHEKNEWVITLSVSLTKYQTVIFVMNGSD
jgi:hypothetical protein